MNRRALSVCAIVSGFEPNDSESRLLLGSAWVHRVLVSICLGMGNRGSTSWQASHRNNKRRRITLLRSLFARQPL